MGLKSEILNQQFFSFHSLPLSLASFWHFIIKTAPFSRRQLCHYVKKPVGVSSRLKLLHAGVGRAEREFAKQADYHLLHLQGICWCNSGSTTETIYSFAACVKESLQLKAVVCSQQIGSPFVIPAVCAGSRTVLPSAFSFCSQVVLFCCSMVLVFSSVNAAPREQLSSPL